MTNHFSISAMKSPDRVRESDMSEKKNLTTRTNGVTCSVLDARTLPQKLKSCILLIDFLPEH